MKLLTGICCLTLLLSTAGSPGEAQAQPGRGIGFRAGASRGPDHAYLGFQTELGRFLGNGRFAPSLDLGLGDDTVTVLNADVRWYLFALPETGLRFYGAAGPGLVFSPDSDLGLNLTAGMHIPMQSGRRYNVELRFGFADVPDLKIGASVLFPF